MSREPLRLGVLASGRGSNFAAIMRAIEGGRLNARVAVLISDQPQAPALSLARGFGVPAEVISPRQFADKSQFEDALAQACQKFQVEVVVLAGFMRLLGAGFLSRYPQRVVNIHPALLPAFPGLNAQKQAVEYGVRFSGCTVHLVDEGMDSGPIIMQAAVPVEPDDDEHTLAERILKEEHRLYPQALQLMADNRLIIRDRRVYIKE
ncbi:MAG: phosphoribosylglycinamide formyltransferase [Methylocystaceae bacterium]